MPRYPEAFLLSLLLVGCSVHIGSSQCEKLPNDTVLEGLISSTFQGGDASISPNITVLEVNYVCLASGNVRGSFSGFSAVVLYECVGERCPASNVSQFEFSCDSIERKWINFVDGSTENLRTDVADANLTSPNRTDCSICFSPTHILANQLTPDMMSKYDNINHCLGCDEACNEGDMKCYDFDSNSCCNFYNLSGGCVAACSADSQPNENFVCTGGVVSLSMSEYVFSEESGSGNVSVEGPAGFNVRVVAVPTFDLEGVQPSGIVINTTVVTPATVSFNITDDDVAFEVDEKYTVTIIPEDGTITVGMGTATIIITDDIDTVQVGFESSEYIIEEGNMTGVRVQVNGESIRDFSLFFIQEGAPQQMLTVMAGEQDILFPTIINPDDEIALQDDRTIRLGLLPLEEFEDRIIVGGQSKTDPQTFAEANLTIVDNDGVTVSFGQSIYTTQENMPLMITLSLDHGIASNFYVVVTADLTPGTPLAYLSLSTPVNDVFLVNFTASNSPQSRSFLLTPVDDTKSEEPDEVATLSLAGVSDGRVVLGSNAQLIIEDDEGFDDVGFRAESYTFMEDDRVGRVVVDGPSNFPGGIFSVQISGGPGRQPGAVIPSGEDVDRRLTSFPAVVTFDITDDEWALEPMERYTLRLTASDPIIPISRAEAEIVIVDDDFVQVGFESSEYILEEGNMTGVRVLVNGKSIRDFSLFFIQEGEPQQMLTVMAGEQDILFPTIINPDDEIALQDDRTIRLGLLPLEEFEDRIIVGGQSKTDQQTFAEANVTIVDNDVVTLGIDGATSRSLFEGDSTDVCVSKDTVTARVVNFLLTALPGSAGPEDFSPITVQNGQLQGSSTSPVCFPFSAVEDGLSDDGESFSVALSSGDSFPTGPGGLQIGSDRVGVTILERIDVEDTVIGDPLFTVPLPASAGHLCYEIRGVADQFFNFISDECVSVNAHYSEHSPLPGETRQLHVIDQIAIRAVDNADDCIDILVDRNGCVTTANSETVSDTYNKEGVTVSAADNIVVVGVPNCGDLDLEMEVVCETRNGVEMIRFEVMRGHNLRDTSHGLLGQFWNVSISTQEFTGELRNTPLTGNLVLVTLVSPTSVRRFPAWQERKTWDNRRTCLFGGNQNGGTVYEVASNHDSLIQGDYTDYRTESEFSTQFKFSQFDNSRCS